MALPGTNAETPIDSHRLDGSLWKPRSILSYPEGHFNPPSDLTLTLYQLLGYVACDYRTEYHSPTESKVTLLQQEIATHGPVLFCYFWHKADGSTAGHAVIVTNIRKTGSNKYRLTVVDPNINTGLVAKEITATPHDIKMNSSILTTIGFYSSNDMNNLSFLDMDSDYNNVALNGLTR